MKRLQLLTLLTTFAIFITACESPVNNDGIDDLSKVASTELKDSGISGIKTYKNAVDYTAFLKFNDTYIDGMQKTREKKLEMRAELTQENGDARSIIVSDFPIKKVTYTEISDESVVKRSQGPYEISENTATYEVRYGNHTVKYNLRYQSAVYGDKFGNVDMPCLSFKNADITFNDAVITDMGIAKEGGSEYECIKFEYSVTVKFNNSDDSYTFAFSDNLRRDTSYGPYITASEVISRDLQPGNDYKYISKIRVKTTWSDNAVETEDYEGGLEFVGRDSFDSELEAFGTIDEVFYTGHSIEEFLSGYYVSDERVLIYSIDGTIHVNLNLFKIKLEYNSAKAIYKDRVETFDMISPVVDTDNITFKYEYILEPDEIPGKKVYTINVTATVPVKTGDNTDIITSQYNSVCILNAE